MCIRDSSPARRSRGRPRHPRTPDRCRARRGVDGQQDPHVRLGAPLMRRVLALIAGAVLAAGLFLSPAADAAVRGLTTVTHPEQRGVRVLNYESPGHREDPVRLYKQAIAGTPVSYTHLRAHETVLDLVCRLLLEKKKHTN